LHQGVYTIGIADSFERTSMKHMIIALVGGLLLTLSFYSEPVLAVGGRDDIDKPMSEAQQNFENGQQAMYKAKYDKAIGYLKYALELERKHTDA